MLRERSVAARLLKLLMLFRKGRWAALRTLTGHPGAALLSLLLGRDSYTLRLPEPFRLRLYPDDLVALVEVWRAFPLIKVETEGPEFLWQLPEGSRLTTYPTLPLDMVAFAEIFLSEVYEGDYRGLQILDVGAYHGYTAFYFLARGATAVACVEPSPESVQRLQRQLQYNPGRPVQVFPLALGARQKEAALPMVSAPLLQVVEEIAPTPKALPVPVWSLEHLLRELSWERVDFAKVNCEGCEHLLLTETPDSVLRRVKVWWVQVHGKPQAILRQLRGLGYAVEYRPLRRELGFVRAYLPEANVPWKAELSP